MSDLNNILDQIYALSNEAEGCLDKIDNLVEQAKKINSGKKVERNSIMDCILSYER
jgi:hypothetical protein